MIIIFVPIFVRLAMILYRNSMSVILAFKRTHLKIFSSPYKSVCGVSEPECLKFSRLCPRADPGWAGRGRREGPSYEER